MDIIKALKENEKPFCRTSEEMQAKALEIGFNGNFRLLLGKSGFGGIINNSNYAHDETATYRLRADYTEDEYELCEIKMGTSRNTLAFTYRNGEYFLHGATQFKNFTGYLYEDGLICSAPVMYSVPGSTNRGYFVPFEDLKNGDAHIHRATHVVFKK